MTTGALCPYNGSMNLKKILLLTIGFIALILGFIGMFLPILPTTPFALVAAACFARSSENLHHWLVNTRHFGDFIRHYNEGTGVPKATKVRAIGFLWIALIISMFLIQLLWVRLLLVVVGIAVTTHISLIRTR